MKSRNIGGDVARSARAAAGELAQLQRAMRSAQQNINGLQRALLSEKIKTPRQTVKSTKTNSFYISALQNALRLINDFNAGQRIT